MKKALFALAMAIGVASFGQSQYEVVSDSYDKILKGIIDRDLIEKDTAFKWYKQNQAGYTPARIEGHRSNRCERNVRLFRVGDNFA